MPTAYLLFCKRICLLLLLLGGLKSLPAQTQIDKAEYYIDTDPGYGLAQTINLGAATSNSSTSFTVSTNNLSPGFHIIGVRSRDAKGVWSFDERWMVLKREAVPQAANIKYIEYYVDADPGYGKGQSAYTSNGSSNVVTSFPVAAGGLKNGLHVIGVRSMDANGRWSFDERWLVLKREAAKLPTAIKKVEYYIDKDPGYGLAKDVPFSGSPTDLVTLFNFNSDTLSDGLHVVGIRSRDADGRWSFDERWILFKRGAAPAPPNITRIEYYVDNDPGYGLAKPVNIGNSSNNITTLFDVASGELKAGLHVVGVRSQDANGRWSFDERWLLFKSASPQSPANVARIEYYIDTDPGYGRGIPVAFPSSTDVKNLPTFINVTGLNAGSHKLFIRSRTATNVWSLDDTLSFTVGSPVAAPVIAVNSLEFSPVCEGGYFKIGYHATGTYNSGNKFVAEISDGAGSFQSPSPIGSMTETKSGLINCEMPSQIQNGGTYKIRVRSTSPALTGLEAAQTVSVAHYYAAADTFATIVCANETTDLTKLFTATGDTVTWSLGNPKAAPIGIHNAYIRTAKGCRDTAQVTVGQKVAKWKGTVNNDWHTAANWSTGLVPDKETHVFIPAGTPNACVVGKDDAVAASIQVANGGVALQIQNFKKLVLHGACTSLPSDH